MLCAPRGEDCGPALIASDMRKEALAAALVVGKNTLSIELHLTSAADPDALWDGERSTLRRM